MMGVLTCVFWPGRSFRTIESVGYVVRVLRHCSHNGFPVVRGMPGDCDDDEMEDESDSGPGPDATRGSASREGPLEGVILRSQLMVLLANRVRLSLPSPFAKHVFMYLWPNHATGWVTLPCYSMGKTFW